MYGKNFDSYKEEIKKTSKQSREQGNKHFAKSDFFRALLCYNKSMLAAKVHDEDEAVALAFANRSAVYFEVKQYKLCMGNIQLAKENGYPRGKLPKLLEREEKCKTLMKADKPQDSRNFFKLSYPANPKIPFIVDCLEMREDKKFGRGIYATQDLKPGDIIAIEKPFFFNFSAKPSEISHHKRCAICCKENMLSLIPNRHAMMFCSDECFDEGNRQIEKLGKLNIPINKLPFDFLFNIMKVLDDLEDLDTIFSDPRSSTIFDYDLNDPKNPETTRNMLKCAASLKMSDLSPSIVTQMACKLVTDMEMPIKVSRLLRNFITRQESINEINNFEVTTVNTRDVIGSALFLYRSLLNNSCDPNVIIRQGDPHEFHLLIRPVKAGEQLFIAYINPFFVEAKEQRLQKLQACAQFNCECIACVKDYPVLISLPNGDIKNLSLLINQQKKFLNYDQLVDELKRLFKCMGKSIKRHPSKETAMTISFIAVLLNQLADMTFCPI